MDLMEEQYVVESGRTDGTPLVMIHGFPLDHTMYDPIMESLEKDFRCIRYDIRGLGKSSYGQGPWGFERYVKDLEAIIRARSLDRPVLMGLSMGGYIALRAMEKASNPAESYRGAVLLDTRASDDPPDARVNRNALSELVLKKGLEPFLKDFVPGTFGETSRNTRKELIASVMESSNAFSPEGVRGALIAMSSRNDTTESLKSNPLPLLFMGGAEDTLTPPTMMAELARFTQNGKFIEIPSAGHLPPLENPAAVIGALNPFLSQF